MFDCSYCLNKVLDTDLRSANQECHGLQTSLTALQGTEQKLSDKVSVATDELSQLKATIMQQNETIKRHERSLSEKDDQLAKYK